MASVLHGISGQQYFLSFTKVYEQQVLPWLDVRSLMRLAGTCQGLHSWLTNLPHTFWQVSTSSQLYAYACLQLCQLCLLPEQQAHLHARYA